MSGVAQTRMHTLSLVTLQHRRVEPVTPQCSANKVRETVQKQVLAKKTGRAGTGETQTR